MQLESYPSENENMPTFQRYFTENQLIEMPLKDLVRRVSRLNLIHELKLIKSARRKFKSRLYSKKSRMKIIKINSQLMSQRNKLKIMKALLESEIRDYQAYY